MDIAKTLSNPWVLGIGVAVGAVMLLARSGGGSSGSGGGYYSEAYLSDVTRTNAALMQTSINAGAGLEGKRIESQTALGLAALSTVSALANVSAVERTKMAESRAGVVRTFAASNAAVMIDQQQNFARLGMTYANVDLQKRLSADRVTIANIEAKTQRNANMWGGISSIAKTVTEGAAKAIIGAPV